MDGLEWLDLEGARSSRPIRAKRLSMREVGGGVGIAVGSSFRCDESFPGVPLRITGAEKLACFCFRDMMNSFRGLAKDELHDQKWNAPRLTQ
jgi:hypothetical protein